jgi:acylphosphatase
MKKIRAIASGQVQGVSYRMYTRQKARQLGVTGYVRNLRNGDVEIVAAGEDEAVDELIKWASSGSPSAVVSDVRVEIITDVEEFKDFAIRY